MHLVEAYKPLGAIGVIITIIGLAFLVFKWPQGKHMTFSQHAAAQKQSTIYYLLLMTILAPFYILFFLWWLAPTYKLSVWFSIFIVTSMLFQYLCALVPELPGWKYIAHRFFAFMSATLLIPTLGVIILSNNVCSSDRVISLLMSLVMLGIVGFFFKVKVKHKYLLLVQFSYFVCYFIAILSVTYLK